MDMFYKITLGIFIIFSANYNLNAQDSLNNNYLLQLYQTGNYSEAANYIESRFPDTQDSQILNSLAYSYRMSGALADAERTYNMLYQQDTLSLPTIMNLASIYFARGNIREASSLYQQALHIDSTNIKVYQRLSEVAIKRNETESAYEYLHRANTLDPINPSVAYNLSMVAISLQAYQFADSVLQVALEDDSVNINLLYAKAVTKDYLKEYAEGIETCEKLMELGSDSLMVMPMIGAMYYYNRDYEKCIETLTWLEGEIVDLKEGDKYYLAMSYLKTKNYNEGFTYLDAAIEQSISPNTARYYRDKGEFQHYNGQHKSAITSYRRSLDFGQSSLAYYQLALINDYQLKKEAQALIYYKRFLEVDEFIPTQPDILDFVKSRIQEIEAREKSTKLTDSSTRPQ